MLCVANNTYNILVIMIYIAYNFETRFKREDVIYKKVTFCFIRKKHWIRKHYYLY